MVGNLPIVAIAIILTVMYIQGIRLSNLAYALMSVLLLLHTVGGYYTLRTDTVWVVQPFIWLRAQYVRPGGAHERGLLRL